MLSCRLGIEISAGVEAAIDRTRPPPNCYIPQSPVAAVHPGMGMHRDITARLIFPARLPAAAMQAPAVVRASTSYHRQARHPNNPAAYRYTRVPR